VFTPERLHEVNVFVAERDVEAVTAALMTSRLLHLEAQDGGGWRPAPAWSELADAYRDLAGRLTRLTEALALPAGTPDVATADDEPATPRPSHDRLTLEREVAALETRVGLWRDEIREARGAVASLERAERQLERLRSLTAPVEALRALDHLHLTIGTLPSENVPRVAAALFQVAFVLLPLERQDARTLVAVATTHDDGAFLDRALASAFFEPIGLPDSVRGPPAAALPDVERALGRAREHAQAATRRGEALGAELEPALALARRRVDRAAELSDTIRRLPCRDGVYVLTGWVPEARVEELRAAALAAARDPVVIESLPPARGRRDVPTLERNPPWLRPFEGLVHTYGLAGYDELDPTAITALTFLLMYGMMFGDIGHGVLLALVGLALRRRTPLGTVVVAAGVASTGFGALYGVAFGATVMTPLWLQPLHAIVPLLVAAVAAGAAVVNLGFLLNLVTAFRNRDAARLWLDKSGVLGVALYWTLLGGGLAVVTGRLAVTAWALALVPLAALMWFREPLAEALAGARPRFAAHALTGAFELFEACIAYLSNTLSFVRLGAFAVAHEGLASMVLRYGQGPSGLVTLVLGTALIVAFEGVIVGIQALRLQYYEFFGRFFEGRGRPFRALAFREPLRRPARAAPETRAAGGGHDAALVP
jgi:V/A-type H+/Na+-transporting ATPase subunit I